ncbi:hypothetical protein PHLCEN_2v4214 [Hermanssonia centrifuga]|uniref:Carbonic anhydrase n=1 Tax=Hermanssonia centrifuga TaxID=98765 RepID=A0A2R6PYY3_9APHY|nr:hypothetical protein PHLCEN_2v4214 [Hermanssonia centrifuga]
MSKPLGPVLRELLDQNVAWADAVDVQDPTFFERSAIRQDPKPLQTTNWPPPAPLDTWLAPLRELALSYPTPPSVLELVKANIQQQVMNLLKLPVVKNAWMGGKLKGVRGWIYELETGHASDLGINVVLGNSQELTCSR